MTTGRINQVAFLGRSKGRSLAYYGVRPRRPSEASERRRRRASLPDAKPPANALVYYFLSN